MADETNSSWQPIETAPKDGRLLLLKVVYSAGQYLRIDDVEDSRPVVTMGINNFLHDEQDQWHIVGWNWDHDCFCDADSEPSNVPTPTHWMEMPAP